MHHDNVMCRIKHWKRRSIRKESRAAIITFTVPWTEPFLRLFMRTGTGEADISGDYNEYTLEQKVSVKGKHAQLKGENNRFMLALWSDNGYSYSVSTNGLSLKKMKELVGGIE